MSKLKFDRLIDLKISSNEGTKVPTGEFWRGKIYGGSNIVKINVNGQVLPETNADLECVEGAHIDVGRVGNYSDSTVYATIQCIAFKVVENV